MIVSLTPNPSIDRAIQVRELQRGEVHRADATRIDPGGKGVNVARAIVAQGAKALAVVPIGGSAGALLGRLLDDAAVPYAGVPITGNARMNITIVEPDGTTTKLNEAGPTLSTGETEALLAATLEAGREAQWIVGCGSLPPGAPDDLYASLVSSARERGLKVAIDSSGAALRLAVDAAPHLIKPNREELEELVGASLHTLGDVQDAATDLVASGIGTVAVSLGADGALLVTAHETAHARSVIAAPVSTVGAGDCMLAGLLLALAEGSPAADALAQGVTWGAAAVRLPGSGVPGPTDIRGILVDLDRNPPRSMQLGH